MEVTDLMVGDLVIKHTATRGDMVCTVTPGIIGSFDFDWSPIPMSEKFFLTNGFVNQQYKGVPYYVKKEDCEWYEIEIYPKVDEENNVCEGLFYVKIQASHSSVSLGEQRSVSDLQHALRLVGLKDVAN